MKNKTLIISVMCLAIASCTNAQNENQTQVFASVNTPEAQEVAVNQEEQKEYEMVFCLDATGSMGGLIGTAKEKIWDIVSGISQSQDVSKVKLGMVFYRDKGDNFETKTYSLTTNIDSIYNLLLAINAQGGGDAPESVNSALNEAVAEMNWSPNANAYRTVFLVGDCPPHMDYNETKYPETCKTANSKNLVINTIKLGTSCTDAVAHFQKIASLTNGEYQQLDQNAKDYVITTPYDDSINRVSRLIDESKIYYGTEVIQSKMYSKKEKTITLYDKSSASASSSRATYNTTKAGKENWFGSNELIQDVNDGKIVLDSISVDHLPTELKGLDAEERVVTLNKMQVERQANIDQLNRLMKEKDKYVRLEKSKNTGKESFSEKVIETMKVQSKRK